MKSLSLELIKGVISGVDSKVAITWVIPRVMDRDSIKKQIVKLSDWMDKVYKVAHQEVHQVGVHPGGQRYVSTLQQYDLNIQHALSQSLQEWVAYSCASRVLMLIWQFRCKRRLSFLPYADVC